MYDCFRCKSEDLIEVIAICNDAFGIYHYKSRKSHNGKVPHVLHEFENFTEDRVELTFCRNCGQIQHPDFKKELTDA